MSNQRTPKRMAAFMGANMTLVLLATALTAMALPVASQGPEPETILRDDQNCNAGTTGDAGDDLVIGDDCDTSYPDGGALLDLTCVDAFQPGCADAGDFQLEEIYQNAELSEYCDLTDGAAVPVDETVNSAIDTVEANTCTAAPVPDTEDPTAPSGLTATQSATSAHDTIDLAWTAATDNVGVDHYKAYYSTSSPVTTSDSSTDGDGTTAMEVSGLSASTTYHFAVAAVDAAGNEGPLSSEASAATGATPPPSGPECPASECVVIPGSGMIPVLLGPITSLVFNDEAPEEGEANDLQIAIPDNQAILAYLDTDGDGDLDIDELLGCGVGIPTNPLNSQANCDNYDGDDLDNDDDPNPVVPDTSLIIELATTDFVAPVYGDELVFEYQCYNDLDLLNFTFADEGVSGLLSPALGPSASNIVITDATPGVIFQPDPDYQDTDPKADDYAYFDATGNCHERGLAHFSPDWELNVTDLAKGSHDDGIVNVIMHDANGIESNELVFTVTNAVESGTWIATCMTNLTVPLQLSSGYDNGYCGNPGETETLNGVNVTYDKFGFPDIHPNPSVDVLYTFNWTFNHTSYKSGDGHNLTEISIENQETDANCGSGTSNDLTYGEASGDCGRNALRTDTYSFDEPTGFHTDGTPYYNMTSTYNVRATGTGLPTEVDNDGRAGHVQYLVARLQDRGGGFTHFGEKATSSSSDDYDKFTFRWAEYTRVNQGPIFDHVATGAGPDPIGVPSHDPTSEQYLIHNREGQSVKLYVILHDDRSYGDIGSPGDDLNLTIRYAIMDDATSVPTAADWINVSNLPMAAEECVAFLFVLAGGCHFEGDGDSGGNTDDGIDDRVDGTTANSEAFVHTITDVEDGKVIHYTWNVTDTETRVGGGTQFVGVEYGTVFQYVVGLLPDDPDQVSTLSGAGLDSRAQTLVELFTGGSVPDPITVLSNPDCDITVANDPDCGGFRTDMVDPWDTDEDGNTNEPNGQLDIVERFAYYIDTDADSGVGDSSPRDASKFDDFDGNDIADGLTLHVRPTSNGVTPIDHPTLRVGDVARTQQMELVVLTDGSTTLCVVENPGDKDPGAIPTSAQGRQVEVSLFIGDKFDTKADSPCGGEVTEDMTLKAVQIRNEGLVGFIVYDDVDNDDERDGAEGKRSNVEATSCEDVLIVAVDENNPDQSYVRLLELEPYEVQPGCPRDTDGDGEDDSVDTDDDGDGVLDEDDDCPTGETGWTSDSSTDNDGDGCKDSTEELLGSAEDSDDDNDGVPDADDAFPTDDAETNDEDGDGIGDNADPDDDNDGVDDGVDACPTDAGPAANNGCPYPLLDCRDPEGALDLEVIKICTRAEGGIITKNISGAPGIRVSVGGVVSGPYL